ncbi:MAG: tyrosine-type recombinase/integrase [Spirochaetia bacterium]
MSSAIALRDELGQAVSFSPHVVRHDTVLDAMGAPRADSYGEHIKDFLAFAEERGAVDFELVRDYFRELNGKPYANNTKRLKRQAVKTRLRAAMTGMDFNQAAAFREALGRLDHEVQAPKVQAAGIGADKVLRRDELDRLLAAATKHDAAFLRFLWATGARVSELTGLRLDQCERQGDKVRLRVTGKGNKERFLRIRSKLYDELRETFQGSTYLFETGTGRPFSRCYVSTRIHRLALSVLGRRLGAHALRHSFATWTIRRTNKIQAVSMYLGHSSTAITMNYYVHERLDDNELFDPEDGE